MPGWREPAWGVLTGQLHLRTDPCKGLVRIGPDHTGQQAVGVVGTTADHCSDRDRDWEFSLISFARL